jgi:hypothetical protein
VFGFSRAFAAPDSAHRSAGTDLVWAALHRHDMTIVMNNPAAACRGAVVDRS